MAQLEKKIKQHQNEMSVSLYEMLKTNFDISVEQFKLMIIGNNLEMLKEVKDKHAERMQALCGTKHILSLNIDKKTLAKVYYYAKNYGQECDACKCSSGSGVCLQWKNIEKRNWGGYRGSNIIKINEKYKRLF